MVGKSSEMKNDSRVDVTYDVPVSRQCAVHETAFTTTCVTLRYSNLNAKEDILVNQLAFS